MRVRLTLWILGLSLLGAAPAFATGTSINFGSPNTISGDTATYTFDSQTVTATGYLCTDNTLASCSTSGATLVVKMDGAGETGLGMMGGTGTDNEIESNDFIQLDFSKLASMGIGSVTLQIQSVQNGEGFRLFESNTAGMPGTSPLSVTGNGSNNPDATVTQQVSVNFAKNQFIDISALENGGGDNNVLLGSLSTPPTGGGPSPTPEPGTLILFGSGLLAAGFVMRRYNTHSAS